MLLDGVLPIGFIIEALQRKANQEGQSFIITKRGDHERGSILVIANDHKGQSQLWAQTRDASGNASWYCPLGLCAQRSLDVSDYARQAAKYDPDIWIIEFDRPILQNPFEMWLKKLS